MSANKQKISNIITIKTMILVLIASFCLSTTVYAAQKNINIQINTQSEDVDFYNWADITETFNPSVKNTGKYSANVALALDMPAKAAADAQDAPDLDDLSYFESFEINPAWTLNKQEYNADTQTIHYEFTLNTSLAKGATSQPLFNKLQVKDGMTVAEIQAMDDVLTATIKATAKGDVPTTPSDNPSDNPGGGDSTGGNGNDNQVA